ncbi:MAG: neutral/alkaline non-lysosomal ceramidase N-terminal domain-containing protein [Cyclobacteriaceae bacterium]
MKIFQKISTTPSFIKMKGIGLTLLLLLIFTHFYNNPAWAQISPLMGGMAQVEITPLKAGYPHYRGASTGAHDPLFAKALVLQQADVTLALVVCDLLWIERDLSTQSRMFIEEESGIPFQNIIIAGTHTHTSPAYHPNIRELTGTLRPPFDQALDTGKEDPYPKELEKHIVHAVLEAYRQMEIIQIELASEAITDLAFNRRFQLKDGKVVTNPGVGNQSILKPTGPIDPELGILYFKSQKDNQPLGTLTNFSLHADTFGGTAFSADYPGFLAQNLQTRFNKEFVSVFAAGACGNINHVDVTGNIPRPSSQEIGEMLAASVGKNFQKSREIQTDQLKAESKVIFAPLQHFTQEELEWSNKESGMPPIYKESSFLERRRRLKIRSLERMRRTEAIPPTIGDQPWMIPLEIQVFTIGEDFALVGLPGELFVELGLAIKENSPFKNTWVIELTNSHIAYVPTREAFSGGSYETVNSRLAPGGGELMVEAALSMLGEFHQKH